MNQRRQTVHNGLDMSKKLAEAQILVDFLLRF